MFTSSGYYMCTFSGNMLWVCGVQSNANWQVEARIVERRQRRLAPPQLRSVSVTKTLLWHRTLRLW